MENKKTTKISKANIEKELKFSHSVSAILDSIDLKKLKTDVNKYIAPKFNLDKKIKN